MKFGWHYIHHLHRVPYLLCRLGLGGVRWARSIGTPSTVEVHRRGRIRARTVRRREHTGALRQRTLGGEMIRTRASYSAFPRLAAALVARRQ